MKQQRRELTLLSCIAMSTQKRPSGVMCSLVCTMPRLHSTWDTSSCSLLMRPVWRTDVFHTASALSSRAGGKLAAREGPATRPPTGRAAATQNGATHRLDQPHAALLPTSCPTVRIVFTHAYGNVCTRAMLYWSRCLARGRQASFESEVFTDQVGAKVQGLAYEGGGKNTPAESRSK